MKIAIYSGEIPSTTFIENLIKGIAKQGHNVVLFGQIKKSVEYKTDSITINETPSSRLNLIGFTLSQLLRFALQSKKEKMVLNKVMKDKNISGLKKKLSFYAKVLPVILNKPDIFHVQWIKGGIEWDFLPQFGIKLIGSFRGAHINYTPIINPKIGEMYKASFPKFNAFHAVSNTIVEEAKKYGCQSEKVKVILGAVFPELLEKEIQINDHRKIKILSVGRFHWKKGYTFSIDACKLLSDKNIDFEYTIIGGVGKEEIPFQCYQLGLKDKIKFIDRMPHDALLEMYKKADVFLLPSVEEGIANVVLEAMAIGIPVVTTDCGGMKEVIKDGENGWIVPTRCPDSIATAILRFNACTIMEKKAIIESARYTIREHHLLPNQINEILELYKKVLTEVPLLEKELV